MGAEGALAGDGRGVEPAHPADFASFLTCVEFVRYGLPMLPAAPLVPWAHSIIRACVRGAARFPHVSGFFTVFTAVLRRADDGGAFRGHRRREGGSGAACLRLADAFIDETLMRARHFKGELLLAALQLLLLLPKVLVVPRPQRLLVALQLALLGGASQPALASLGVSALTRLHSSWSNLVRPALPLLLPHLGALLEQGQQRSDADADAAGVSAEAAAGFGAEPRIRARERARQRQRQGSARGRGEAGQVSASDGRKQQGGGEGVAVVDRQKVRAALQRHCLKGH